MKLIQANKSGFVFELGNVEKESLVGLLGLYPQIPSAHHQLSKSTAIPNRDDNQQLLEEAMAEQRAETSKQLQAFLKDPKRFHRPSQGWHFRLRASEIEWLFQILNDIRVGSWIRLGAPAESLDDLVMTQETMPQIWALELAGHFQMILLRAMENKPEMPPG